MPHRGASTRKISARFWARSQKYQKYGGKVSLERIARVLSAAGDRDSLKRLFKLVVVSVSVGNLDSLRVPG